MKNNMVKETKSELKKVIWPTKKTVLNGTVVVAVMVIIVGAIILVFDFLSSAIVKTIISDDNFSITEILDETELDHEDENVTDPVDEAIENSTDESIQTPVEENSEPTIDNNEITE